MAANKIVKLLKSTSKKAGYAALILVFIGGVLYWQTGHSRATTATFTTSGTWNVPSSVSSAVFEAWGGGGAGGGTNNGNSAAGGGAGGQYAKTTLTGLVFNAAYTVTVAATTAGTAGAAGSAGADSKVVSPSAVTFVLAKGGAGGALGLANNTVSGGTGSTTSGVGDLVNAGGSGGSGVGTTTSSGGGGGGAGSTGSGGSASGTTAGTGTTNNGGNGGAGIVGGKAGGNAGSNYGGGGSGAVQNAGSGTQTGGTGAQGLVTVTYSTNSAPAAPTLSAPSSAATGVALTPQFQLSTTDANSDYVDFEVQLCSTNTCSSVVYTACEVSGLPNTCTATSQTGWSGQNANGGLAYAATPSSGTTATYTYQGSALSANTQYWWRAYAIDPGGSNTASSASAIQSFTTNAPPNTPTLTAPSSGATGVSLTPAFSFSDTDPDSDDLQFKINLFQSDCSTSVTTYDMASGQTGWTPTFNGSAGSGLTYTSTTAGSGVSFTPSSALSTSTTYCWSVSAKDPGGTNTTTTSGTRLFTTVGITQININGGVNVNGGTNIQ